MAQRTCKTKFATKHQFGSRKQKSQNVQKRKKTISPAVCKSEALVAAQFGTDDGDALPGPSSAGSTVGHASPAVTDQLLPDCVPDSPSLLVSCECVAAVAAPDSAFFVEVPRGANDASAVPSTSRTLRAFEQAPYTSTGRTVQAHFEPEFISPEVSRKCAAAVHASLSFASATERKMRLTSEGGEPTPAKDSDEFLIVLLAAMNVSLIAASTVACVRAYMEFCTSLGIRPAGHALRRATEKDASRKKKACKALQAKGNS